MSLAGELAKALGLRDDIIGSERKTAEGIVSRPVGGGVSLDARFFVRKANRRAGDYRSARIGDTSDDHAEVLLSPGRHQTAPPEAD